MCSCNVYGYNTPVSGAPPPAAAPKTMLLSLQVGSVVFSGDRPKDYKFIIEAADKDENIRVPAAANITDEMRNIMPLTPDWTYWPDYERVRQRSCCWLDTCR